MAQVESVDFPNKRVYLHQDTVTQGFDVILAHFEIKVIVHANINDEQGFYAVMTAEGNNVKSIGKGTFTPKFGLINQGWRFIPKYIGSDYNLDILSEIVSLDGVTDRDVFDRSGIPAGESVNIDPVYDLVEIREIDTGSGVTGQDITDISQAVIMEATLTPIHSNVKQINDAEVLGDGTSGDKWRGE